MNGAIRSQNANPPTVRWVFGFVPMILLSPYSELGTYGIYVGSYTFGREHGAEGR
jgi:hypothetical protein